MWVKTTAFFFFFLFFWVIMVAAGWGAVTVDVDVAFVLLSVCRLVLLSSVFVHCTIPESMEACFLVVLGGGGGGVLLGSGGGTCL